MSFEGLSIEKSIGRRPYLNPVGFRGISIETPINVRYIKVVDFRGNPFPNTQITLHNSGGDFVAIGNQNGIIEILPDVVGTLLFDLKQYKTEQKDYEYIYANEFQTKTVILDASTSHL